MHSSRLSWIIVILFRLDSARPPCHVCSGYKMLLHDFKPVQANESTLPQAQCPFIGFPLSLNGLSLLICLSCFPPTCCQCSSVNQVLFTVTKTFNKTRRSLCSFVCHCRSGRLISCCFSNPFKNTPFLKPLTLYCLILLFLCTAVILF